MNNSYQLQQTSINTNSGETSKASLADLLSGNCIASTNITNTLASSIPLTETPSSQQKSLSTDKLTQQWCRSMTWVSVVSFMLIVNFFLPYSVDNVIAKASTIFNLGASEQNTTSYNLETDSVTRLSPDRLDFSEFKALAKYVRENKIKKLAFTSPSEEKLFISHLLELEQVKKQATENVINSPLQSSTVAPVDRTHKGTVYEQTTMPVKF